MAGTATCTDLPLLLALETLCAQDVDQQTIMLHDNLIELQQQAIMAILAHGPPQLREEDGFRQCMLLHLRNIWTCIRNVPVGAISVDMIRQIASKLCSLLPHEMYHDPVFSSEDYEVIANLLEVCLKKDICITMQQSHDMLSFLIRQLSDVYSPLLIANLIGSLWKGIAERCSADLLAAHVADFLNHTATRIDHVLRAENNNVDLELRLIKILTSMARKDAMLDSHLETMTAFSKRILQEYVLLSDAAMELLVSAFTNHHKDSPEEAFLEWFDYIKGMATKELEATIAAFNYMSTLVQTQFAVLHDVNHARQLRKKRKQCYNIMFSCSKLFHRRLRRLGRNAVAAKMERLKLFYRYKWCEHQFVRSDLLSKPDRIWNDIIQNRILKLQ